MKKPNYKILLFNNSKGSIREIFLSKPFALISLSVIFAFNLLLLHFFSDSYVAWRSDKEIRNHKKDNELLIENMRVAENRITNIEEKIYTIVDYDNEMRDMLKMPRIHEDVRELGIGGTGGISEEKSVEIFEYLLPEEGAENLQDYFRKLDFIERSTNLEILSFMEMSSNSTKNKTKLRHLPAIHPVDLSEAKFTSKFGYRRDPFSRKYKKHEGHDFSAKRGTKVVATADGLVVSSRYNGTFGNYIEISHGNGYKTAYGHLNKRNVSKGTYVVRGQKIGEVGNTGKSTAPHLHYEIKHHKKRIDPSSFYFDGM